MSSIVRTKGSNKVAMPQLNHNLNKMLSDQGIVDNFDSHNESTILNK